MIGPDDDIDRIMAVMAVAFDPAFGEAWNRRQLSDALVLGTCHYRLVDAQARVLADGAPAAGFYLSRFTFEEEELLLLAVDPRYRRAGIGQSLLDEFARSAGARGAKRLLLEMRSSNPAERLYRRFGFVPVGLRPDYYRSGNGQRNDAITFALELQ
ncbi:MAG TPA: GNAT family N-acetyltransferase [Novosphingobium sp.]|nr:GNAT family N-acetyltransferase [Novosphingobium sp.]